MAKSFFVTFCIPQLRCVCWQKAYESPIGSDGDVGTITTIQTRPYEIRHRAVFISQAYQSVFRRIEFWPPVLFQPPLRVFRERNPSILHDLRKLLLSFRRSYPAHVSRVAEEHFKLGSMVCATGIVQAGVRPIAEVSILPSRNALSAACPCFDVVWASE